ncbi:MAG: NADH-quinone oxidoreductase subunit H [Candidatus Limnocylindrales bacterium]
MTVISRRPGVRLTLPGKIVLHGRAGPPLALTRRTGRGDQSPLGGPVLGILAANLPIVRFVVAVTIVLLMTVPTAFLIIYMEMKIIALMNLRIGPDRVGPFGSLLSVVHGLKVLDEGGLHPDRRGSARLHLGPGRGLPVERDDPARASRSRRACSGRTSISDCSTSSPSAACPWSAC